MRQKQRYQKAKQVTVLGAWINAALGTIKIVTGYTAHSHALIADGVHSLSDLITDALVVIAAKYGSQKPDEDHPYGHGRIETIATIVIALLIGIVGLGIIYDALYNLFVIKELERPELTAIIIAAIALVIKEWLYRYTLAAAKKIDSNLLRANAWHHRSDVFVSGIVLIGIFGAWLGYTSFDAIAALLVGALIVKIGGQMMWQSARELVDTGVDENTLRLIKEEITSVPGVESIHQLRTRMLAGMIFVDAHVLVNPHISVSEGHYISEQVHLRLRQSSKKIHDVTVHIDPEDDEKIAPSVHLPNRDEIEQQCRSCWKNLPCYDQIKKINLHYLDGKLELEIIFSLSALNNSSANELIDCYKQNCKKINIIDKVQIYFQDTPQP